ncbi:RNA polymerase sigma factor [Candidatus Falkowbacteria bacterium]|nr:RNA polymerase sigma factor [Candidatus Falkowbacteria bacterium]
MKNPLRKKILFLKVKNKDKEAYGRFYDLYATRIYRFIFFKINSVSDAQDLTSEVFLKLWQYIKEDKEIKNLNAFTYMVARNTVIDFYRSKHRKEDSVEEVEESDLAKTLADNRADPLAQQIVNSDLNQVLKGLENLKDEYKEVIILKYLDELSIGEIAEVLNKSRGAVRVLLHRAAKALKETVNAL